MNPGTAYFIKLDAQAIIPSYKTEGAAACDLSTRANFVVAIEPQETEIVYTGLVCIPPSGYHWNIYLRSSTGIKYPGLILSNCIGIIDSDYCGPEDEIKLILRNTHSTNRYIIDGGTRIAQMELVVNTRPDIQELSYEELRRNGRSRGGLGSTG